MRRAFLTELERIAAVDERVVLLTGDLGYSVIEGFQQAFPHRFFNVGVAEQNMLGVAVGLAEAGYTPYVYSIATFLTMRAFEFIRNGPVLHQLPIRLLGIGGGFEYASAGPTHHATEDCGLMRQLHGMTVVAPADYRQAAAAATLIQAEAGPVYLRLGKRESDEVPGLDGRLRLGHLEVVREGADVVLLTTGAISIEVNVAAHLLSELGVEATVAVVASLAPAPKAELSELIARSPRVVTVESHSRTGGLGSLVAELIAEECLGSPLVRLGIEGNEALTGSETFLNRRAGLDPAGIAASVRSLMDRPLG